MELAAVSGDGAFDLAASLPMDSVPRHVILWLMRIRICILTILAGGVIGCSNQLETGYKPQSLGASSAVRRSYYASPFSPEAQGASQDQESQLQARHPRPGS